MPTSSSARTSKQNKDKDMGTPGNPFTLASWRREVAELYAGMRNTAQRDPKPGSAQFRAGRDSLILHHPESPLSQDIAAASQGIDYFPCDPAWRLIGTIDREVERAFHSP